MDKHIIKFNNHTQYEAFIASTDYVEPHVSICKTEGHINYNANRLIIHNDSSHDCVISNTLRENIITVTKDSTVYLTMIPSDRKLRVGDENCYFAFEYNDIRHDPTSTETIDDVIYQIFEVPENVNEVTFYEALL